MIENLVSTIIPVFNRGEMLREAVASVLAQTWRPIEIVIVDDGSTDETAAVVRELEARHPGIVRSLSQRNAGPGAARQFGLSCSEGEFVQFLDSDDLLLPRKFDIQVRALREMPSAGISYGATTIGLETESGGQLAQRTGERHEFIFPALLAGRLWETSTPLYRRTALNEIGAWPTRRQFEDIEFDAQAGAVGIRLHYTSEAIAHYRVHSRARLAGAWAVDPRAARDTVDAFTRVLALARQAGVPEEAPELAVFSRFMFLKARQFGAAGWQAEAKELFLLARAAAGSHRGSLSLRVYRAAAAIFGWRLAGKASVLFDIIRAA